MRLGPNVYVICEPDHDCVHAFNMEKVLLKKFSQRARCEYYRWTILDSLRRVLHIIQFIQAIECSLVFPYELYFSLHTVADN